MTGNSKKTFKLLKNHKNSIQIFRQELEYAHLNDVLKFWRDNEFRQFGQKRIDQINELTKNHLIPQTFADKKPFTVGGFNHIRHQSVVDYIKKQKEWSDFKKNQLIYWYAEFTIWLKKISFGWFNADYASSSYQMSLHAMKKGMSMCDWRLFIDTLTEANLRDGLVVRMIVQGQKRISEVLELSVKQIDFKNNTIKYQSKKKVDVICYDATFMIELKEYIQSTEHLRKDNNLVFITRTGKKVTRLSLNRSLANICQKVGLKKTSPDYLRGIYKMFIQQGYKDGVIMHSRKAQLAYLKNLRKNQIKKDKNEYNNELPK